MSDKKYLGIEIGGSKLQLVLGDGNARVLERHRHVVDPDAGGDGMRRQIEATLKEFRSEDIAAIGVGYGGPVDRLKGKALLCHHAAGWSGFPLAQWLSDLTGVATAIDNDGNTGALGEAVCGAGKGFDNIFYITLGSGVGSGWVVNGKIYHGAFPGEAEIGHIRLDKTGRIVESSCSGWAVDRKIRDVAANSPGSVLAALVSQNDGPEARVLSKALQSGDPEAIQILDETCDDLAFAISHVVQLIHPEIIVLGGGLSFLGEPLRALTEQKVGGYVFQPGPPVRLSALQEDAVPVGALLLAINHAAKVR